MVNILKKILLLLEQFLPKWKEFFIKARHSFTYDLLTYRDLLDEVLRCKPVDVYDSASVIKDEMTNKIKLKIVYLDSSNEPIKKINGNIHGFCIFAKDLDEEIKDIFGNKNIIIIK